VRHILGDSERTAVITMGQAMGHDAVAMIESIRPDLPNLRHVIVYGEGARGDAVPLDEVMAAGAEVSRPGVRTTWLR